MIAVRRLLFLAYHFPPLAGMASVRSLRFARWLPAFGWQPCVLTPALGDYPLDASLAYEGWVERTPSLELSRTARGLVGSPVASQDSRGGWRVPLRNLARRWIYWPDAHAGWQPFALARGRELLQARRFDAVFSTAFPMTTHRVAGRLAREFHLPWVADFRDLWSEWSSERGLRLALDRRLEAGFLRQATAITTVSPTYLQHLLQRGATRGAVLTNSFDDPPAERAETPPDFDAAYLGTYYPDKQGHLLELLAALAKVRPGARVLFIGTARLPLTVQMERCGLDLEGAFLPAQGHAASVAFLQRARLLLLAGPPSAEGVQHRGNVAGKVFEYLGSGRPVLASADPGSDLVGLLASLSRAAVVTPGDAEAASRAAGRLLALPPGEDDVSLDSFRARNVTERLARLLDDVVEA